MSVIQVLGSLGQKALSSVAKAGEVSGAQRAMTTVLEKSAAAGRAVGARSQAARTAGTKLTQIAGSIGIKTPQQAGVFFASTGKYGLAAKGATKAAAVGKTGIDKLLSNLAPKVTKQVIDKVPKVGKGVSKTVMNTVSKKAIVQNPVTKGIMAGAFGAAMVAVPVAAYSKGKEAGAKQLTAELDNMDLAYQQGFKDSLPPQTYPQTGDMISDPITGLPFISDPTYEPMFSAYPPTYAEVNRNGLFDGGSIPMPIRYSNEGLDEDTFQREYDEPYPDEEEEEYTFEEEPSEPEIIVPDESIMDEAPEEEDLDRIEEANEEM